jgi:hypothetical protein
MVSLLLRMQKAAGSAALTAFIAACSAQAACAAPPSRTAPAPARHKASAQPASIRGAYARLPLSFEPNRGQASSDTRFVARGQGYSLSLTPTEARFALRGPGTSQARRNAQGVLGSSTVAAETALLRMKVVGAAPHTRMTGESLLPGKVNYLVGADLRSWRTDIPTYGRVHAHGVYPGIDLVYYGNQKQLEYDFVIAPGADPSPIALKFEGASHLTIDRAGDLTVGLNGRSVRWHRPVAYQEIGGKRKPVAGRFVQAGAGRIGFAVARYDTRRALVIDPVFAYSTYLGGGSDDMATGIALDASGDAFVTGLTASSNFPGTSSPPGTSAGFLSKIDPTGTILLYSTYLGAAIPQAVAVDGTGQAYLAGLIESAKLPVVGGEQSAFGGGPIDGFLMKVNAAGNGLGYSTYIGGSGIDVARAVALGPDGSVYIAGDTNSTNLRTVSPYQAANGGDFDAFIVRVSTTASGPGSLLYSTYLGGTGTDFGSGIAVDPAGRFYVTGYTTSSGFPTASAFQPTLDGAQDAFVTGFTPTGAQLIYSTYLGGSSTDSATAIAVDASQRVVITGSTFSSDLPARGAGHGVYSGSGDAFVAKIDLSLVGSASLIYTTYIHGGGPDAGAGVALDVWGNAYATGYTFSPTPKAYVFKVGPNGAVLSATAIGGTKDDRGRAIAVDPLGYAVVAGITLSSDYPVTPGAIQTHAAVTSTTSDAFVFRAPTFTKLDLNGDASPDLLFQSSADSRIAYWLMQGNREISLSFLTPPSAGTNWNLVGSGDFNGDNSTDLLFQNSTTGDLAYWYMHGTTATEIHTVTPVNPGTNWNVVGVFDFNRDGYPDILFQNSSSLDLFVWYMRGTTMIGGQFLTPRNPGTGWRVAAVGDLNNDGQADIVFQNSSTGNLFVWNMRGVVQVGGGFTNPANPGAGWNVAGLADIETDGRLEILFQNGNSGDLAYWVMSGLNLTRVAIPTPNNPGGAIWKLVGSN